MRTMQRYGIARGQKCMRVHQVSSRTVAPQVSPAVRDTTPGLRGTHSLGCQERIP